MNVIYTKLPSNVYVIKYCWKGNEYLLINVERSYGIRKRKEKRTQKCKKRN